MFATRTTRCVLTSTLTLTVCLLVPNFCAAQRNPGPKVGGGHNSIPGLRMPGSGHASQNQEHLAQWMDRHSDLPLAQQQKALESEPGFRDLPSDTQQRMRERLTQLNSMPPEQRRRVLERNEAMANLSQSQRQQVRGAMKEFSSLSPDRRRLVARAFRDLREMPEPQRQTFMSSDRFRGQFSDQERNTVSNLLAVEPYLPVHKSSDPSEFGK